MDAFEVTQLLDRRRSSGESYLEFLRVPAMSLGLYVLPAGAIDPQSPHTEDEVYEELAVLVVFAPAEDSQRRS
jgi:hypothetical protein